MTYKLVMHDGEMCAYLYTIDPPQYLTLDDLINWMRDKRDEDPDLHAELVQAYVALSKATPPSKSDNSSIVNQSAISKRRR